MMAEDKINIRLRLIIIREGKLLASYYKTHDYYFYVGGHMELGETVLEGCQREVREECGEDTTFELKKILYIRDFFDPKKKDQNVELFILGEINKFEELEHYFDSQHPDGSMWLTWLDLYHLPENILPRPLGPKILADYQKDFPTAGEYVGQLAS